ncbi:hypothetical protein [Biformimicrobium ophioploci]|uniref:Uncharacterized protein n=1 Tax=Biformimicrobium ophioploci TaxID=3036711 RepID=A0ABQ6M1G3_9GAMM|nr:hypothetical protein [Microbulbifer sp. NKW57]GMG88194.1 hypothetical protein MNKW57_25150 [Microbulbifer sp. NKW57]
MRITLVKKRLSDGNLCSKCRDVHARLQDNDQLKFIDRVLIAEEGDTSSEGTQLARQLGVDKAPFFVVEGRDGRHDVYTVYFKFAREVLAPLQQGAQPGANRASSTA